MARQSVLVPVGLGDSARQCMRQALTAAQANFTELYPLAGGVSGQNVTVTVSSRMNLRLALAKAQANIDELYTLLDGTAPQNVSVAPGRAGRFNLRTAFGKLDEVFTDLYALAGGGGDGGPEPVVVLNFKDGVYTSAGASAVRDDLIASDAANFGVYESGDIVDGTGFVGGAGKGFLFAGDASIAALADGAVVVVTANNSGVTPSWDVDWFDSPDYSTQIFVLVTADLNLTGDAGATYETDAGATGVHKVAVYYSAANAAASINGGANITVTPVIVGAVNASGILANDAGSVIEKVEIYTELTAADLPALSALS